MHICFNVKTCVSSKKHKNNRIKKIGIIGVGEGSTEHWRRFCENIGITQYDLIKETGATFKLGIYFKNWSNNDYLHNVAHPYATLYGDYYIGYGLSIANRVPKDFLNSNLIWKNRFVARFSEDKNLVPTNQYHFDTHKLNNYLHKLCLEREIELVDDEIIDAEICETTGKKSNII